MTKYSCILGIQAEYDANAKDVQPAQGFGRIVVILFEQCLVDAAHYFACLHRYFHLLAQVLILDIHKKLQTVILFAQIFEQYLLGLAIGLLHIIN